MTNDKYPFGLDQFSDHAQKEGFCLLHSGAGGKTMVGLGGKRCSFGHRGPMIGYLAYSNPTLKNDIPAERFYGFEELKFISPTEGAKTPLPPYQGESPRLHGGFINFKTSGHLQQSVTQPQYIKNIKRIKELLAAGEIYQLCYAIRFRKKFQGDPYALFLKLNEINPTDFSAFLNCGDFQIVSSSPERFFKVKNGQIITQPIKGTARKSANSQFSFFNFQNKKYFGDKNLKKLIASEKERAELDMITDLERNDVGKICEYGTLRLTKERELLEMKNIWHTYSEVRGKLRPDLSPRDVICAMFPGGSITGCPKKRAMEYIEELEGLPRNIFTGSIGYIKNDKMDFNIAIRTALIKDSRIEYWAGGGIVADSDPESEYEECLLKAERFLSIL